MGDRVRSSRPGAAARRGIALARELSPTELLLLAAAPAALPAAALGLRLFGLSRMQRLLGRRPRSVRSLATAEERATARRLARVVGAAALYGPWPANCLQRSLVLWWYLRVRGIDVSVRIGVRRDADGSGLAFHAWVEHGGDVLNDSPSVRTAYATFERPMVPTTARFT